MRQPFLVSVPHSGASWLAQIIGNNLFSGEYHREYFNPSKGPREHEGAFGEHFGAGLVGCYRNIASPPASGFDALVRSTWSTQRRYTFTFDEWNPFKLEGWQRHFKCFVLVERAKVLKSTEVDDHCWHALDAAGFALREGRLHARAQEAHRTLTAGIEMTATALKVPILERSTLAKARASELVDWLSPLIGSVADVREVARAIIASRTY